MPKTSQKTRKLRTEPVAAVVRTEEPTPMIGTATIVHSPDGIHAAADASAQGSARVILIYYSV